MGILYLAAHLRTKFDVELKLVNQRADNCSNEELADQAIRFQADIVGFGALTPSAHAFAPLTKAVRKGLPKSLILLGGPHVNAFRAQTLENTEADAAVAGEGERYLERIVEAYLDNKDLSGIPGLYWRNGDGEIITNPGALALIEDLDTLPFPAYDLIDLRRYWTLQSMPPIPRRQYVSLVSSRGCPYQCKWCHQIFGDHFRGHSAERIAEEIAHYQKTYGIKDIEFVDDIYNFDRKRVFRIADMFRERDIRVGIAFPNAVRTDLLTQETVDALIDSGTYFCSFALESGSDRIQKLMGKNLNIPRFVAGVEMMVKRGVFSNGFNMLGFPTETEAEMQQTIDIATNSMLHTASFFTVLPFPNTRLYYYVLENCPERLGNINYNDTDFALAQVNLSAVPDEVLYRYQRKANREFFSKPSRIYRILRDFPQPHLLPFYVPIYMKRLTKGLLGG